MRSQQTMDNQTIQQQKQEVISQQQIEKFRSQGFLVLENFSTKEDVEALKQRAEYYVDLFDPSISSLFSTKQQAKVVKDLFERSAYGIECFLEEDAQDDKGKLTVAKHLSVNKMGHAMMDMDDVFIRFSRSLKIKTLLKQLGMQHPTPVQSQYIFKQPKIGGQVVPHQDSTFLHSQPLTTIGLWWAIEDANANNGCLVALPSSHSQGIHRRFYVDPKDDTIKFDRPAPEFNLSEFIPLEMKAGSMVILDGCNVHASSQNHSEKSRHAYSVHYIDKREGVEWSKDNWLQRPSSLPFKEL